MRIFELLDDLDVIELDIEVLIYALENTLELDVVLELNGDLVVDESLEEARFIPEELVFFARSLHVRENKGV